MSPTKRSAVAVRVLFRADSWRFNPPIGSPGVGELGRSASGAAALFPIRRHHNWSGTLRLGVLNHRHQNFIAHVSPCPVSILRPLDDATIVICFRLKSMRPVGIEPT